MNPRKIIKKKIIDRPGSMQNNQESGVLLETKSYRAMLITPTGLDWMASIGWNKAEHGSIVGG